MQAYLGVKDASVSPAHNLVVAEDKLYCRYCGAKNKKETILCESCGKLLKGPAWET